MYEDRGGQKDDGNQLHRARQVIVILKSLIVQGTTAVTPRSRRAVLPIFAVAIGIEPHNSVQLSGPVKRRAQTSSMFLLAKCCELSKHGVFNACASITIRSTASGPASRGVSSLYHCPQPATACIWSFADVTHAEPLFASLLPRPLQSHRGAISGVRCAPDAHQFHSRGRSARFAARKWRTWRHALYSSAGARQANSWVRQNVLQIISIMRDHD